MKVYQDSALSVFAMASLFLGSVAGLIWLSTMDLPRPVHWSLAALALLGVLLCHFIHGRLFDVDPETQTITVSTVWLRRIRTSSVTRPLSELKEARVEWDVADWLVLEFADGKTYLLTLPVGQRGRLLLRLLGQAGGNVNRRLPVKTFRDLTGTARVAIAVAIVAILPSLLLDSWQRWIAIGTILLACLPFLTAYRVELDRDRAVITIRTRWLGRRQKKAVTYGFSEVRDVRGEAGDNYGCVVEFTDGRRLELAVDRSELRRLLETRPDTLEDFRGAARRANR